MKINEMIDHTYLKPLGTKMEIDKLLDEAKQYNFKSVCVNPTHVKYCSKALAKTEVLVCTVIGFPLGANTVEAKVFETLNAVSNGADEIDMVINMGEFRQGNYDYVEDEIKQVCKAAMNNLVKVNIETSYLGDEQIKIAAELVGKTKAAFIKTSTGFGTGGATKEAVKILKDNAGGKEVEAVGSIRTQEELQAMIEAGATRIGTTSGVKLMNNEGRTNY